MISAPLNFPSSRPSAPWPAVISSNRAPAFCPRSIESRNLTAAGRSISEAMRSPPIWEGFITISAPALVSLSVISVLCSFCTVTTFMPGLRPFAVMAMKALSLSFESAQNIPRAFFIPEASSTAQEEASPLTEHQPRAIYFLTSPSSSTTSENGLPVLDNSSQTLRPGRVAPQTI